MNFNDELNRVLKYSTSDAANLLSQMEANPELQRPDAAHRHITADALTEAGREPEAEMPREERIKAIQAIVERKIKQAGMTSSQRQAKWRENNPEKHRVYMLNYMTRYRARRKAQ